MLELVVPSSETGSPSLKPSTLCPELHGCDNQVGSAYGSANGRRGSDCSAASRVSSDGDSRHSDCGSKLTRDSSGYSYDAVHITPNYASSHTASDAPSRHLQLGNIAPDANKEALEQLLGWFGPLESVYMIPEARLAFATFPSPEYAAAAKAALEGQTLPCVTGELPFVVQHLQLQQSEAAAQQPQQPSPPQTQIGIPPTVDGACSSAQNDDLASLLSSFCALGLPVPSVASGYGAPAGFAAGSAAGSAAGDGHQQTRGAACHDLPSRHLFLTYVAQNADQHSVTQIFARFGVVESVRVFPGLHYAFVNYADVQSAIAAKATLEGQVIPVLTGNKPMHIRYKHRTATVAPHPQHAAAQHSAVAAAQQLYNTAVVAPSGTVGAPQLIQPGVSGGVSLHSSAGGAGSRSSRRDDWEGAMPAAMAEGKPGRRLWVGNVPQDTSQNEVAVLFAPYGPLESVRVFPDRNFAFVNYVYPQHAAVARSALNDRMIPGWNSNRTLLVRYPRDRTVRDHELATTGGAAPPREVPTCNAPNVYYHAHEPAGRDATAHPEAAPASWGQGAGTNAPAPHVQGAAAVAGHPAGKVHAGFQVPLRTAVQAGLPSAATSSVSPFQPAHGVNLQQYLAGLHLQAQQQQQQQAVQQLIRMQQAASAQPLHAASHSAQQPRGGPEAAARFSTAVPEAALSPAVLQLLRTQGVLPAAAPAVAAPQQPQMYAANGQGHFAGVNQDAIASLCRALAVAPGNAPAADGQAVANALALAKLLLQGA